jgi:ketosteroid isomerase-like protein
MAKALAVVAVAVAAAAALYFFVIRDDDEDQVRDTLNGFAAATRDRDFRAVCDHFLTTDLKERIQLFGRCPAVLQRSTSSRAFDPKFKLVVESVDVSDDHATAKVRNTVRGKTGTVQIRLEKQHDQWRLATLR